MPIYQTRFLINAPAARVWEVLTTLERYGEWNPQIPIARGTLAPGSRLSIRLTVPARPAMNLVATIEDVVPDRLLSWRGHVLAPWFFEGYRQFAIEPIDERRVHLRHVEDIHGRFAPVFTVFMGTPFRKSHDALNWALRARAEGVTALTEANSGNFHAASITNSGASNFVNMPDDDVRGAPRPSYLVIRMGISFWPETQPPTDVSATRQAYEEGCFQNTYCYDRSGRLWPVLTATAKRWPVRWRDPVPVNLELGSPESVDVKEIVRRLAIILRSDNDFCESLDSSSLPAAELLRQFETARTPAEIIKISQLAWGQADAEMAP